MGEGVPDGRVVDGADSFDYCMLLVDWGGDDDDSSSCLVDAAIDFG